VKRRTDSRPEQIEQQRGCNGKARPTAQQFTLYKTYEFSNKGRDEQNRHLPAG
jgi:hypothetical protein